LTTPGRIIVAVCDVPTADLAGNTRSVDVWVMKKNVVPLNVWPLAFFASVPGGRMISSWVADGGAIRSQPGAAGTVATIV
jgi:hypothetical protein